MFNYTACFVETAGHKPLELELENSKNSVMSKLLSAYLISFLVSFHCKHLP